MSEDDFQRMLDANPDDWHTRLVFADWLQDRDDPRAEGYRALGKMRRVPLNHDSQFFWTAATGAVPCIHYLPPVWFYLIENVGPERSAWEDFRPQDASTPWTRREAEDAAALAWGRLSEEERQQCHEQLAQGVAA